MILSHVVWSGLTCNAPPADSAVVCPWEAFGDMELSDLAQFGIVQALQSSTRVLDGQDFTVFLCLFVLKMRSRLISPRLVRPCGSRLCRSGFHGASVVIKPSRNIFFYLSCLQLLLKCISFIFEIKLHVNQSLYLSLQFILSCNVLSQS